MPRIYYFTPYHPGGLGLAYNEHCALVPNDDDWICITDSDVMFFSSQRMGDQIEEAITRHPEYDVFTCVTNRMCGDQQIRGPIRQERDLVRLKIEADKRTAQYRGQIKTINGFFAGYFILFPKRIWKEIPFPEIGSQGGRILGIDSAWCHTVHQKGKKVGLMLGLMATHFYRLDKGEGDLSHLSDSGHDQYRRHVWNPTGTQPEAPKDKRQLRIRLNPNLHPPTGYRLRDTDGLEHVADSAERLVRNVTAHRMRLKRPPGNPMKELTEQIFARHPNYCIVE